MADCIACYGSGFRNPVVTNVVIHFRDEVVPFVVVLLGMDDEAIGTDGKHL